MFITIFIRRNDGKTRRYFICKRRLGSWANLWKAVEKMSASTIQLTLMKKDGKTMDSTMILVPMVFEGHMFAVHFITSLDT
jgi:hypothetical protein